MVAAIAVVISIAVHVVHAIAIAAVMMMLFVPGPRGGGEQYDA